MALPSSTDPAAGPKGISAVVAERGTPGFVVGDLEDLCGMRANPVSSIRLYDCRVPKENLLGKTGIGLKIGLEALDTGRIGIAAQALGIAQAALEKSVLYANQRQQFGVPLARHQAVQIHGGYGYSKAYAVERYYRDARVTRIASVHRALM